METLVLIHGAIGGGNQMIPLKEALKNDFDVHILEFDGHGDKAQANVPFTLPGFVQQLNSFIHSIGNSAHVFGYSMGGFVALQAAVNGNGAIKSVCTLGTKMSWNEEIAENETKQLNPKTIKEKVPRFYEVLESRHGEHWIEVLDRTAIFINALGQDNPMNQSTVSKITCPVQLLLADKDQMVTELETAAVQEWIPNSTFEVLENSQHPIERVDLANLSKQIVTFIQGS